MDAFEYAQALELMTSLGAFGEVKLNSISERYPALTKRLTVLDPLATVATFSGLLLQPELQSNCLRIETLIHLALAVGNGKQTPNPKLVADGFNQLGNGLCGSMEDPAEDVFVSSVRSPRGNFRILEGIWEGNAYFLQKFIEAVEDMPVGTGYDEIRTSIYGLLRLSDMICERAGLQRNQLGDQLNIGKMSLNAAGQFVAARHQVRFKLAELPDLGIDPFSLAPFLFTPCDRALLLSQTIGNSDLERHPLVRDGTYLYIALPTAISVAIRNFVIERMTEAGMRDAFCRGLANVYARTLRSLPLLGARRPPAINFKPEPHAAITQVGIEFDVGRFIQLLFFTDNLRDFEETGFSGLNPDTMELDDALSESIAAFQKHAQQSDGYRGGLTLIVGCGIGRAASVMMENDQDSNWRILGCSSYDFETLSWLTEFKPETMWRILEGQAKVEQLGVALQNANGLLNLVAWSRELNGHLVPHGEVPDDVGGPGQQAMMIVTQNGIRELRHSVAKTCDARVAQFVDGTWLPIRKNRLSIFKDDERAPLYATEVPGEAGRPIAAFITTHRTWWVELFIPEDVPGLFGYERFAMLSTWLSRAAEKLEGLVGPPPGPIYWKAEFRGKPGDFGRDERRASFDEARATIQVEAKAGDSTFRTIADTGFERAVFHPENIAERAVVAALIDAVNELAGKPLSAIQAGELLQEIVKSPAARHGHAFVAREFRDHVRDDIGGEVIHISRDDDAFVRLGLGWAERDRSLGPNIVGKAECSAFLNSVVRQLEDEICADLNQFGRNSFLKKLLRNKEFAANDRDRWRRTTAAMIALHPPATEAMETIAVHDFKLNAVFQTSRILAEMAICACPAAGTKRLGKLDLSRLMAKAGLLFHIGGWSDAIRWGVMKPELRITPLGDIHAQFGYVDEIVEPFARATAADRTSSDADNYPKHLEDYDPQLTTGHLLEPEFAEAWEEQFGLTFDETRVFVDHCENLGITAGKGVISVRRAAFDNVCVEGQAVSRERALGLLDELTLLPRDDWRDVPTGFNDRDRQPWRFRRRLSLLRKPFLQIEEESETALLFAPGQIRDSFIYMLGNYHRGEFPQEQLSPKMKSWAGKSADRRGAAFSAEVAAKLGEMGWQVETEVRVTKLLGRGFDMDYGDVDVLAWDAASSRVLIIECKDLHYRKTYGEISEQLADFRGELRDDGKRDYLLRHFDRMNILHQHLAEVVRYVGISSQPILESHLVFKNPVPMQFALKFMEERVTVSNFDQLPTNFVR
ncbi:hypothetical protein ACFSAG_09530 [Sphingorhabdus buctiana]|uniref:Uncharacterized protein n=1 Tax=Sphingorhabdus buctiana TaxID=1508805 RepID=A0ABW4MD99_9SPHN